MNVPMTVGSLIRDEDPVELISHPHTAIHNQQNTVDTCEVFETDIVWFIVEFGQTMDISINLHRFVSIHRGSSHCVSQNPFYVRLYRFPAYGIVE
jgi:hypothetical protein